MGQTRLHRTHVQQIINLDDYRLHWTGLRLLSCCFLVVVPQTADFDRSGKHASLNSTQLLPNARVFSLIRATDRESLGNPSDDVASSSANQRAAATLPASSDWPLAVVNPWL